MPRPPVTAVIRQGVEDKMPKRLGYLGAIMVAALLAQPAVSSAQTISFADAITELAKACGADIKKHCAGVNLGNNACLGSTVCP